MEGVNGKAGGGARHNDISVKFCDQGQPLPTTPLNPTTPSPSACPYHFVKLETPLLQNIPPGVHPLQQLEYTPLCDLPVGISGDCNVGTAASAGCACVYNSNMLNDAMFRELDAMTQEPKEKEKSPA
ncbi:hypothetical protein ACJQWK_10172 [Exserohilum turcicum]|uniref:Uncharacterized protein n=1 Tax=Exserohilum turcicum (strain 28A) TaxID=671987 RepID=R0KGT6_EXST2|nr:uncharacterized protein SETTUDRAFT_163245 [Exserohilum turcica Et28A]EOA87252.1 hypothetical protein SETTUDRAFT_163245 [Exserohilum turcica Et28A]